MHCAIAPGRPRRWLAAAALTLLAGVLPAAQGAGRDATGADGLQPVPPLARVTDQAGALSAADRAALSDKLRSFEAPRGAQIAIVLLPSTRPEPLEDYAHRVGEAWKIGRKGTGDGMLIVVAVKDRAARIDVARSLEGAVPDAAAARIVHNNLAPHFATKDYAGGLNEALDVIFTRIAAEGLAPGPGAAVEGAPPPGREDGNLDQRLQSLLPLLVGGLVVAGLLRRLFGVLGAMIAAGGALAVVAYVSSSLVIGLLAGLVVFVLTLIGAPMLIATQVLGGRGGFGGGGFGGGGGGGGFRSGGGGDFSGGGASGSW
jgi:uncharacterized protein